MNDFTRMLNTTEQGDTPAIERDRLHKYNEPFRYYFEDI